MQLILNLGNVLNGAGPKGGAVGFKLDTLEKLAKTRSISTPSLTLLHFLFKTVDKLMPEVHAFVDELALAAEAYKRPLSSSQPTGFRSDPLLQKMTSPVSASKLPPSAPRRPRSRRSSTTSPSRTAYSTRATNFMRR